MVNQINAFISQHVIFFYTATIVVSVFIGLFIRAMRGGFSIGSGGYAQGGSYQSASHSGAQSAGSGHVVFSGLPSQSTSSAQSTISGKSLYYHGGLIESVFDILRNRRIKVGSSKPSGFWVTSNFHTATTYANRFGGGKGAVVAVQIDNDVDLKNRGDGIYVLPIPESKEGEYWAFDSGVKPIGVLDIDGNPILPNLSNIQRSV